MNSLIFPVALLALGALAYALYHLISGFIEIYGYRQLVAKELRRRKMKRDQRHNQPWYNYTIGRLHRTIAR